MSSAEIPFNIAYDQQSLRLLELPSTLHDSIKNKKTTALCFKSVAVDPTSTSVSTSSTNNPKTGNAFLCTDDQTFQVRQVQSSNSIYVVKPIQGQAPDPPQDSSHETPQETIPSLTAISLSHATLELIPTTPSTIPYLKSVLPVYEGPNSTSSSISHETSTTVLQSKFQLLSNGPFSTEEFETAWIEICAFESKSSNQSHRPSPTAILGVWKSLLSGVEAAGSNHQYENEWRVEKRVIQMIQEEENWEGELISAVLNRIGTIDSEETAETPANNDDNDADMYAAALVQQELCIPWTGTTLLQTQTANWEMDGIQIETFMQRWRDLLPEHWRDEARLELLKGKYSEHKDGTISFVEESDRVLESDLAKPASGMGKGPRKWHDKFKQGR
ncbi:hypothetical protein MMC09_006876 [Bachmanniomyces sp. S44760]|nr:hypothetical protein [Bachmanniomyces sp. S44760]